MVVVEEKEVECDANLAEQNRSEGLQKRTRTRMKMLMKPLLLLLSCRIVSFLTARSKKAREPREARESLLQSSSSIVWIHD